MEEESEAIPAYLSADAVMDAHGNLSAAFLHINLTTLQIGFYWLPELFRYPMPGVLREEIVKRLRLHADRLESGELEKDMQKYTDINEQGPVS